MCLPFLKKFNLFPSTKSAYMYVCVCFGEVGLSLKDESEIISEIH